MDKTSIKSKFDGEYKKHDLNKKARLTRSPSFGKRIPLSSNGEKTIMSGDATQHQNGHFREESTSQEGEKYFADNSAHKLIMAYHIEESIAEDIQKHKFYDLLPNDTKDFHEYIHNVREYLHACYIYGGMKKENFEWLVKKFADKNEKLKDQLKVYESDKVVRLERLVEKLEERDKQLEQRDEEIISEGDPEKWKEIDKLYWIMKEQKLNITLPLANPLGMGREVGGPSDQQGQGQYLKREEYLEKERQMRQQQKQELISYYREFYQKFQKSHLLPNAQELAKDAKRLSEEIKSLLDEHRTQWENMVNRLKQQRQNSSPDMTARLELPQQKILPNRVERLELLKQKTSLIQDKWEKREAQYRVKNIEGDNRLWGYIRDKMSKELLHQAYEINQLNIAFEKIKKNEVGDTIPDIDSKVHDLLRRSKDMEENIKVRLAMLNTNDKLKDGFIEKYRELIEHFHENARYFGFRSDEQDFNICVNEQKAL
jgi:hypothetical protein